MGEHVCLLMNIPSKEIEQELSLLSLSYKEKDDTLEEGIEAGRDDFLYNSLRDCIKLSS